MMDYQRNAAVSYFVQSWGGRLAVHIMLLGTEKMTDFRLNRTGDNQHKPQAAHESFNDPASSLTQRSLIWHHLPAILAHLE